MTINIKKKVFNIGFHKTGTTSLTHFMHELGYTSLHSVAQSMKLLNLGIQSECAVDTGKPENFQSLLNQQSLNDTIEMFDFFSDNPWPLIYEHLDKNYSESKFILTVRNTDRWIKSLLKHSGQEKTKMRQLIYGYGNPQNHIAQYRKTYIKHNKQVQKHFKNRDNLLVIDIEEDNTVLAKKVTQFLNIDNPDITFPTSNKR